jgi:hypothetical protein
MALIRIPQPANLLKKFKQAIAVSTAWRRQFEPPTEKKMGFDNLGAAQVERRRAKPGGGPEGARRAAPSNPSAGKPPCKFQSMSPSIHRSPACISNPDIKQDGFDNLAARPSWTPEALRRRSRRDEAQASNPSAGILFKKMYVQHSGANRHLGRTPDMKQDGFENLAVRPSWTPEALRRRSRRGEAKPSNPSAGIFSQDLKSTIRVPLHRGFNSNPRHKQDGFDNFAAGRS